MGTVLAIASLLTALAPILTVFLQALRKSPTNAPPQINTQDQLDALRTHVANQDAIRLLTTDQLADELCQGPPAAPPTA